MNQFGLFAKAWLPGQVKTRLGQTVGRQAAADIYLLFLKTLLTRFEKVAEQQILAYTPVEEKLRFHSLGLNNWQLNPQSDGDLGSRMKRYFQSAFQSGAKRVLLIGTDSPDLPLAYIEKAFIFLKESDVVIGPCDDGGYYLIGMSQFRPEVFDNIQWSTDSVYQSTLERLDDHAINYRPLPSWYDVDTQAELIQLCTQLKGRSEAWASHLLNEIEAILKS